MSWNMHKNKGGGLSNSDASEVLRIYQQLTPKPDELVASGRKFVKEGDVQVWSVKERMKKNRHLFLFNDVLLITKKEGKKKYWLKVYISLKSDLKIQDVEDSSNERPDVEFRIYAPKKTFIMFGFNPSHKQEWLGAIQQQIDNLVGKVETVTKERIRSLYVAPPQQSGSGGGFQDPFAEQQYQQHPQQHQSHYSPEPARASIPPQQAYNIGPLDAARSEEPGIVPMLPPPPGMKHLSQAPSPVAHDPFAQIPLANQPAAVQNPFAPPNYAQPQYQPQPQLVPSPYGAPHGSVYGAAPLQPQQQQYASIYGAAPLQPQQQHASIYGAAPLQPQIPYQAKPLPAQPSPSPYSSGAALGGGIPALPPKPVPNPNASQDPFASLMKPLPTPAGQGQVPALPPKARDPFGDDDFDQLARRSQLGNSGNPF